MGKEDWQSLASSYVLARGLKRMLIEKCFVPPMTSGLTFFWSGKGVIVKS